MISRSVSRGLRLAVAAAAPLVVAALPAATSSSAAPQPRVDMVHIMQSVHAAHQNAAGPAAAGDVQLHYQTANAPVETTAKVYLVFWGEQWSVGWADVSNSGHVYTSGQAMTYITDFFKYVGSTATSWNGVTTQYCEGTTVGSTSCSGGTHVTNPPVYGGSWVDTTSPPPPPVLPDNCAALVCLVPNRTIDTANLLAQEALRAEAHFGYDPNADYMLMLPEATTTIGADTLYCAYHSETTDAGGRKISYTNMPYVMNANVDCGENFVNADSTYGNGFFDGYSIVAGHEFSEAETDPLPFTATAWQDSSGAENADKCAWITPGTAGGAHNIGPDAGGHIFAVQTTWSNSAGGCAG